MGVETIGNTILNLRRKKGVTQEKLAEFIGVTKTSVSKWETGTTLPDIQILPILASYFDVSVDELIGYVPMLGREQIRFEYQRLAAAFANDPFAEVIRECEGMIKKYYSCYSFLQQMLVLLLNHAALASSEQEKEKVFAMAFDLCEHILTECQDVGICKNVIALKGMFNLQLGRADLVIEEIEEETLDVNRVDDMGTLLTLAYLMAGKTEEAGKSAQIGMYRSLMDLIGYGLRLLDAKGEDVQYGMSVLQRLDKLLEDFSVLELSPNTVAGYEYQAAVYLANRAVQRKDMEEEIEIEKKIFERLEHYVAAAKRMFAENMKLHGDAFFYYLDEWFEGLELGTESVRCEHSVRESAVQGFLHPAFTKLKDQKRLQKLMEEISNA